MGVWRVSWWVSGGCLKGVWKVPGWCLEGIYGMSEWYSHLASSRRSDPTGLVWWVSGGCLEGVPRVSGRCQDGVWRASMGCLNSNLISQDW